MAAGSKTPPDSIDGRVLAEALERGPASQDHAKINTLRATATFGTATWNQYLQVSEIAGRHYLDCGNAGGAPQP